MTFRGFMASMLGLGMMVSSSSASTTYNSAAAFATDFGTSGLSQTTIDFTNDGGCNPCVSVIDSNTTFASGGGMTVGAVPGWANGNVLKDATSAATITISPASTYLAFGIEMVTAAAPLGPGFAFEVEYNDGTAHDFSLSAAGLGGAIFFGVISSNPITNLQVVSDESFLTLGLDDVQIGSPAATPEGSTMLLIGGGLILLTALRRRRQRARA